MDCDRSFVLSGSPVFTNIILFKHVMKLTLTHCLRWCALLFLCNWLISVDDYWFDIFEDELFVVV